MLPKERAPSHRFVRPSILPSVCPKSFLPNPWTKLDKTSYSGSREISINCKNFFLNRCKIYMFKLTP